jgi:hypothetical protein
MMGAAAEITGNTRGQRRWSGADGKKRHPEPTDAGFEAVRMVPKGFERREFARNSLGATPKPGKIAKIAGDGRQREVIWIMSDRMWDYEPLFRARY